MSGCKFFSLTSLQYANMDYMSRHERRDGKHWWWQVNSHDTEDMETELQATCIIHETES